VSKDGCELKATRSCTLEHTGGRRYELATARRSHHDDELPPTQSVTRGQLALDQVEPVGRVQLSYRDPVAVVGSHALIRDDLDTLAPQGARGSVQIKRPATSDTTLRGGDGATRAAS